MADRFYSMVRGESLPVQVTEGSSTSSEAIELRVNDSVYASRLDVIFAVEGLLAYLKTRETTPIA